MQVFDESEAAHKVHFQARGIDGAVLFVDQLFKDDAQEFRVQLQLFIVEGVFFQGKVVAEEEVYEFSDGVIADGEALGIVIFMFAKQAAVEVGCPGQMCIEGIRYILVAMFVFAKRGIIQGFEK